MSRVLESWRGTRYQLGNHRKGVATDCLHFVTGVLDEMNQEELSVWPKLVVPTLLDIRNVLENYNYDVVRGYVLPGDVVVSRGKLFHLSIIGSEFQLWSAKLSTGVQPFGLTTNGRIRVFRPDKSKWQR